MRSRLSCLFLLGIVVVLSGCGRQGQSPAGPETGRSGQAPAGAAAPAWRIQLAAPEDLAPHKPVEFTARMGDARDQPVGGAEVELFLNMPDMNMGENKVRLTEKEPGVYAGKAVFTMKGNWEVAVRASKGSESATKMFRYTVK